MLVHQYVQHDWSPALWAVLLLILATVVFAVMALFLLGATRPKRWHAGGPQHPHTQ